MPAECVGLIGLGLMGSALAERLRAGGFDVLGYDVLPERVAACQHLGVRPASGPADVAAHCRRIILSLLDSASVNAVLEQMWSQLRPGHLILDTTTGTPEESERAGQWLSPLGVTYLDATISGNRDQVLRSEVTVMAGGPGEAFQSCQDLLRLFAGHALHVGGWGAGAKLKLVTNLALGLNRVVLAEALVFAESLGIEPVRALEVLRASMAYSRIMDTKGPKMVAGDFTPQARLSQHLKDVRLILEAAGKSGLELPLSRIHKTILEQAEAAGLGSLDNTALIEVLRGKAHAHPAEWPPAELQRYA